MPVKQLARLIGTPDCPRLVDMRIDVGSDAQPGFIPGAFRHAHSDIAELADDLEQLEAGMLLYDAVFRWGRDATDEGHDWPASS